MSKLRCFTVVSMLSSAFAMTAVTAVMLMEVEPAYASTAYNCSTGTCPPPTCERGRLAACNCANGGPGAACNS